MGIKIFFYYSGLPVRLVLQSDGTLTPASIDAYRHHFPGCLVHANHDRHVRESLADRPLCQFFLQHHPISKKLLHPLILSQAEYIIIMDSDILWFRYSAAIADCVQRRLPFYMDGGTEAYARNRRFMETALDLSPAHNLNSGIIGYRRTAFLDLPFIDAALRKLADVPLEQLPASIGYDDGNMDVHSKDARATLCWWVMEQTIYALLMGREAYRRILPSHADSAAFETHQFTNSPIADNTCLVHYISDSTHKQFFPVGVDCLLQRGCLETWMEQGGGGPPAGNSHP